jgi:nucleotidyltransferase/DNA polymerase involved in DNA repair
VRDRALMNKVIEEMAADVHGQLKAEKRRYKTVTLKVRFTGFETHTSQKTLKDYTDGLQTIIDTAKELLKPYLESSDRKIRLLGVRVSKFEEEKK